MMHDEKKPTTDTPKTPVTYWTTLEQLRGDPEVERLQHEEFFEKPALLFDAEQAAQEDHGRAQNPLLEAAGFVELAVKNNGGGGAELSRRDFLKLSAAAAAFATAGCGLRPTQKLVPYVNAPEQITPGVPNYYASTLLDHQGTGVLVKTREGRPIKLEGNPDHPLSQGKLTVQGQAEVFNLYDPDRLQGPVKVTPGERPAVEPTTWAAADEAIGAALAAAQGRVAVLTGTIHGPARTRVWNEFTQAVGGRRYIYDAWNYDATRKAQELCYGTAVLPRYHFDKAEYVLSLGADFLGTGYSSLEWQVDFGKTRKIRDGKISKLVTFEPFMTLTGANSDERFRMKPDLMKAVAFALAQELGVKLSGSDPSLESLTGLPAGTVRRLAEELRAHREKSIVIAGEDLDTQILVNAINSALGNEGVTIDGSVSPSLQSQGSFDDAMTLVADINAGNVDVLLIYDTNPVYTLPASAGFAEALGKVKTVVYLGDRVDETGRQSHYVLPGLHFLEAWGDAEPQVGLCSLTQPSILLLYDNRAAEDTLLALARVAQAGTLGGYTGNWHDYLLDTWQTRIHATGNYEANFKYFFTSALRDGVVDRTSKASGTPRPFNPEALASRSFILGRTHGLQLVVYPSPMLHGGEHANNAWLLEAPDPVSKICWTNYASISPATAQRLGFVEGQIAVLHLGKTPKSDRDAKRAAKEPTDPIRIVDESQFEYGDYVEIPVHIQPGDADDVVSVQTGWGRQHVGKVGNGVGVDVFPLRLARDWETIRHSHDMFSNQPAGYWWLDAFSATCGLRPTDKRILMPNPQGHNYTEGRPILYEATLAQWQADPSAGHELHAEQPPQGMRGGRRGTGESTRREDVSHSGTTGHKPEVTAAPVPTKTLHEGQLGEAHEEGKPQSIWKEWAYEGNRWGMVIDPTSCIGCNACVLACQVENNIPVVGEQQILKGREMHWIRIDRYFSGTAEDPDVAFQPMLCQHCENAPCETVCPVIATLHNDEGLNLQIYNRCVGTRYCSNNCPYKVRRFNWHEYAFAAYDQHPLQLALNPEVTVREKGVMEKCTFCVQRIRHAKHRATQYGRPVDDSDMQTACQQTCPTDAIVFGNMNNPDTRVAQMMRDERSFYVLEELNTRPSIAYYTKLRNRADGGHA